MKTSKPLVSAIAAMAENRVIGFENELPWYLPADLQHFKSITSGHPILMGRKTFESIGRPLPNRTNIVLTRDKKYKADGCIVVTSISEAVTKAEEINSKEIFIIGGAEVYNQLLPSIERLYLTIVHADCEGDTFFPELDLAEWREVNREAFDEDDDNEFPYTFLQLDRVQS